MWVSETIAIRMAPTLSSRAVKAPVAQWIERCPPEAEVAGSNPAGRVAQRTVTGTVAVRSTVGLVVRAVTRTV